MPRNPCLGTLGCLIAIWVFWLQPGLSREYSVRTMRFPAEEELLPSAERHTDGLTPPMDWGLWWAGSHKTSWWAVCSSLGSFCPFPGRSSCNIRLQFIMSRRTWWLMPLWLALRLVDIGTLPCRKGTMPLWQMDSCVGMLYNQQV